jgi:hypothetical protein
MEVGDLVLRRILSREGMHKLSPMWEGPFKVTHIARQGSARLETMEGVLVGNPWNIAHLRKFYTQVPHEEIRPLSRHFVSAQTTLQH